MDYRNHQQQKQRRALRRRPHRGGYVLVLMAVMLFALMALAALVIDFGLVRLTQTEMQSGVNASALEGLRWRDVQRWEDLPAAWMNDTSFLQAVGAGTGMSGPIPPQQRDAIRRWAAANVSTLLYHQPANPKDPDPAQYGAGPEMFIDNHSSNSMAGPIIAPATPPVYQPQLQTNSANAAEGDIVTGAYGDNSSFASGHGIEDDDYSRGDFFPATSSGSQSATALLARMRRVAPGNSLDDESGISSAGDALPYLFGRGAPMDRTSAANGVTVRGAAIAAVGPITATATSAAYVAGAAKSAGWAQPASASLPNGLIGAVPVAIDAGQWKSLVEANAAASFTIANDGTLTLTVSGQPVGYLVDQSSLGPSAAIGMQAAPASVPPSNQTSAYVLLETTGQVIGFGAIDSLSVSGSTMTLQPVQGRVANTNASAALLTQLPTGTDAAALWRLHDAVNYPLYAPVLVNRLSPP